MAEPRCLRVILPGRTISRFEERVAAFLPGLANGSRFSTLSSGSEERLPRSEATDRVLPGFLAAASNEASREIDDPFLAARMSPDGSRDRPAERGGGAESLRSKEPCEFWRDN